MNPFRRPGGFFEIAPYGDIFDGSELGRERARLWNTYLHEGRGFLEVLHIWAEYPQFRALVEQTRNANRMQAISTAWRSWFSQSEPDAKAFTNAQSSHVWNTLDTTAKATFLAITHALLREGLLNEIQFLTEVRGKLLGTGAPFRLYCLLKATGPASILSTFGRTSKGWNYFYEPHHPICYRQSQSAPSLEVSTREQATALKRMNGSLRGWEADIVIDYREAGYAHISPDNFDVTALSGSQGHYQLHEIRYGGVIPGLVQFRPQINVSPDFPVSTVEPLSTFYDSGVDFQKEPALESTLAEVSIASSHKEKGEETEPRNILDVIE